MKAVVQYWVESERDWDIRPDGVSIHRSFADLRSFINNYWDSMPDEVPDEYSRPTGSAQLVEVPDSLKEQLDNFGVVRYYKDPDWLTNPSIN